MLEPSYVFVFFLEGMKVKYDLMKPAGNRLVSASIRCIECDVPEYEPLEDNSEYTILTSSFIANGGDGFSMIPKEALNHTKIGKLQGVGTNIIIFGFRT